MDDFLAECQGYVDEVLKTVTTIKNLTCDQAEDSCLQLENNLQSAQEKAQELQQRCLHLAQEYDQTQAAREGLDRELEELQEKHHQLKLQMDRLLVDLQQDASTAEALQPERRRLEAEVSTAEAAAEKKLARLQREVERYEDCLGLSFVSRRGERELRLEFTHIDPQQPNRPFVVGVNVLPDSQFEVTRCEPPIDVLPKLAADLNNSRDFGSFVCAVRAQFVAVALDASHAVATGR